jgi:hypothetical protein
VFGLKRTYLLPVLGLLLALALAPSALASGKARISGAQVASPTLTVATQSPSDGQAVSGSITWSVSVAGATPSRVDFAIDGNKKWSQATAPYLYGGVSDGLDTKTLANGAHTLTATAYGSRGLRASSTVTVNVENAAPASEPAPEPEPASEPEPAPEPSPAPTGGPLYWGATIGPQLTGMQAPWDMAAVTKFEELAQKKLSLVQFFQPFSNCSTSPCSFYGFPTTPLERIRQHGAIPVLSWGSQSIPASVNEPDYQQSDILSGKYDSFIRSFATAARAWGHPFFLRYDWEMNGTWFSWSDGANGNRPGEFAAAWRHVHDIFAEVGATNATWVWCPNIDPANTMQSLSSVYPGDAYVDWTGLDGYNWGTNPAKPSGWQTFGQLYSSTYRRIVESVAPSKPMMIGEVASSEYGGSKASWIKDMLARVPAEYPKIRALLWFDKFDSSMDWPIETSATATAAFAEGIRASSYDENSFLNLSAGSIQPPG